MRPVTRSSFTAWNEDMSRRHDPDLYHRESPLPVRLLERRRVAVLLDLLDVRPGERVLEVGCGAGNVLEQVPGERRVGVDLSEFLLGKARARLGARAALARMDAESLAFASHRFDKVYCTEVLEHVMDPAAVLAELRRVLRPSGLAVVSVPNEALINRLKRAAFAVPGVRRILHATSGYTMPDHMEDEWHLHEFDREKLADVARGLFTIETLRGIPTNALPLRWVATLRPTRA